ncbi:MAG: hypothetical protein HYY35_00130 [Deltaproteobacteria bacterium]|nr:hypothetical protein [Deltaproteobacteria bacterium]
MKNRHLAVFGILASLALAGSARAESLGSKLSDMTAAVAGGSNATNGAGATAPGDPAERQALEAEVQDAVNRALERARFERQPE